MGYKNDWQTCDKKDLDQYFNIMHKVSVKLQSQYCQIKLFPLYTFQALDMYLSVAILRLPNGLDCSQILGDESSVAKNVNDIPRTLQPNESSADLMSADRSVQNGLSGSMDSLSRNVSQGSVWLYSRKPLSH